MFSSDKFFSLMQAVLSQEVDDSARVIKEVAKVDVMYTLQHKYELRIPMADQVSHANRIPAFTCVPLSLMNNAVV